MPTLSEIGALLDLEFRAGCDFSFTIDTSPHDLTGSTAVMNLDFPDTPDAPPTVHPLVLEVLAPFKIHVVIPASMSTLLPPKSRHIIRITAQDGDIRPLAYGTSTCLREPE